MKVSAIKTKTFEEADAVALDLAYDTWRAQQNERQFVDSQITVIGTNIIMVVFYTE